MMENKMQSEETPSYAIDIVCGMEMPIKGKMIKSLHEGETYYFCSLHCKEHFDAMPTRYVFK